jgi:urea transport system permease protein
MESPSVNKQAYFLGILMAFMLALASVASAQDAGNQAPSSPEVNALLTQLTDAGFNQSIPILEQLEATAGEAMLPVFKTMLAGDLYYLKADKSLMAVQTVAGKKRYTDVFSGEALEGISSSAISKIKVNNKLRGVLRQAISRIQLNASKASAREQAILSLLSELDDSIIDTLKVRQTVEDDDDVLDIMSVAFAMHDLVNSEHTQTRIDAIALLEQRLENDVRNLLTRIKQDEEDARVKAAAARALKTIEQRVENFQFIDKLFFGLSLGSVLLLAAIGLAITFGVMGVINMAHGEMIMLGAYTTYVVQLLMPNSIDYSIWVAIPAAFVVSGCVGILIERGVIRHLHGRPLETLLATFGISLILQQLVRTIFSPLNRQVASPSWMSGSVDINPVLSLTLNRLYILAFALLVFGLLLMILNKTNLGLNVRAVAQNRNMAKAMGIRTDRVDALTFGLGSGIAGMAGVALSQLTNVGPNLGQAYIIDSFMVVVFGGVGNLWGTLVAGFSLGIANKFIEPITGAVLASILVLIFIILFIQKRPKGLFPQKGRAAE